MSDSGPKSSVPGRFDERPFLARLLDLVTRRPAEDRSIETFMEAYLDQSHSLQPGEREILANLASFSEMRVHDVMVPRADVIAVDMATPLDQLAALFRDAQHSRLPIYRDTLDDPVGMVHVKDIMALLIPKDSQPVQKTGVLQRVRRNVLFVPPSMRIVDLLLKMQKTRIHMALVIDEYGGTDGLVTIEDLVEEIVGDIEDEHDVDEVPMIQRREDGSFDASGRLAIDDLVDIAGADMVPAEQAEDIDTLGGLVFSLVGRVPQRGEIIRHPKGFEFEILDADPRRVKKVRVHGVKLPDPAKDDQSASEPASDTVRELRKSS